MLSRDSISKGKCCKRVNVTSSNKLFFFLFAEDADSSALSYEDINLAEPDAKVVEDLCLETLFVSHLTEE